MKVIPENYQVLSPFFNRLEAIFTDMDNAYQKASSHYNFHCNGCDDNCCMTHFFHHTHLEYFYILNGIDQIEPTLKTLLLKKAQDANQRAIAATQRGDNLRLMCPLNVDEMCMIYKYRPMICRMHGIPHELRPPGRQASFGPGCDNFQAQCGKKQYVQFDRTPFYVNMANLEKEMKQALGITEKFKKNITQMLVD
jgi:Fe-S-cluster containining protein